MKRRFVIGAGIYMVIAAIRFWYLGNVRMSDVGVRCLSDHLCDTYFYGHGMVYPIVLIVMIGCFGDFFRSSVILRYRKSTAIIRSMLIRCAVFSFSFSLLQTCVAVLTGLSVTGYASNWDRWDSYVAAVYGIVMEKSVPTIMIIALYLYVTFIHIFIMGCILCMMWYLTERPIAGFVSVLIVLSYEFVAKSRDIFFNVISIEQSRVVFGMNGIWELCIYPLVLLAVIIAAMKAIICNKDLVKLT